MQATKNCFSSRLNENARFYAFAILRGCKTAKKVIAHADRALGMKHIYKHGN